MGKNHVLCFFLFVFKKSTMQWVFMYIFAFDYLFPKCWIELNNLDMLKIYHLFLSRILSEFFIVTMPSVFFIKELVVQMLRLKKK